MRDLHAQQAPLFAIAQELEALAMEVLPKLEPPITDNMRLIAAVLFGRILTSFQSVYVLTERGLCGDARTLVRALAESAIVLGALVQDPSTVTDQLVARHIINERKLLSAWLDDPQAVAIMSPEQLQSFKARLAENRAKHAHIKVDPVDVQKLARSANLLWLYNSAFRYHSSDAAHTSALALERHVKVNEAAEITALQFGPNAEEVPNTLSNAVVPMLSAMHTATEVFGLKEYHARLDKIQAHWKALTGSAEQTAP